MELYILSKQDLSILSVCKVLEYQINLDEETNAKTTFSLLKANGVKKDNFIVLNGLYRQFLFVIEDVQTDKDSNLVVVTALDIANIFDKKVIEKNTEQMKTESIEAFLANTISNNFVNSDDTILNINYIDIAWHTNTKGIVETNAENGLYNFHTFIINCRQYKNIYTEFKFENGRLKIDISYKEETIQLVDTTLPEVTDYNKIYEEDVTAKVTVLVREDGSEYNLYLKTDRTTTTDKNDPDRAKGKIEVISVDTVDKAPEEALNIIKGNSYNHLVEFKISKTSKLMDITKLTIGRPIRIKTDDDIYDSYISALTLSDENFVYFKSGKLRTTFLDKIKQSDNNVGNKLDKTGGVIYGNIDIKGNITKNGRVIGDIATVELEGDSTYTGKSGIQKIPYNVITSVGDKLLLANNSIKIGAGINKVLVSATINPQIYQNGVGMGAYLYKNSEEIMLQWYTYVSTTYGQTAFAFTPILLEVEEGDTISVKVSSESNVTLRRSFLTVQSV